MKSSISTVISFCSNEIRFIKPCLESLKDFSPSIYLVVWDHFFDGTPENEEALFSCFERFPKVQFLLAPFVPDHIPKKFQKKIGKDFWFNCSLLVGEHFATSDYILFLDIDEIIDASAFSSWLQTEQYRAYDAMRLENFWYFRTTEMQAVNWEDSPVLAKKGAWQKKALRSPGIRHAVYNAAKKKMRHVVGLNGQPMIHHYSWVRTKEEVLKKMRASAHKNENDWEKLIEEEWCKPPSAKDFVHGYELKKVTPFVELDLSEPLHFNKKTPLLPSNVRKIDPSEFLKIIGIPFWQRIFFPKKLSRQ